jgi:hypothetical protein
MKFEAKSVDPSLMRYVTTGDWEIIGDSVIIPVVDYGAREDNAFLVALHELVESYLCKKAGIKEEDVYQFDIDNPYLEEPGDSELAPYYEQHKVATDVEKIVCEALGLNWREHNDWVQRAANEVERVQEQSQSAILRDGPRLWAELHLFSFRNRNCQDRAFIENWFNNWVASIPWNGCPCQQHFEDYCKQFPPDFSDLWKWGIGIHNDVNLRNGKPTLSLTEAENLWLKRLI